MIRNVMESEMVDALIEEIDIWEQEEAAKGTLKTGAPTVLAGASRDRHEATPKETGRTRLPVLTGK